MPRWTASGVALLASAWLLLLIAAPFLVTPLAAALYGAGALICHQLPERSFHLGGFQLPVCARCFGLYAGGAMGGLAAAGIGQRLRARPVATNRWNWIVTAVAAVPTGATFVLEWGAGWPMSNTARAIAALWLGAAVAFVVVRALATLNSPGEHQLEEYPEQPGSTPGLRARQRRGR